ncbi:terminase small subunit [Jeotgalibaca porci]|uniref:terminase small subunit n=1 Tax=Jeotgalibaca porci TaxID=1868793 RepID=UPI0035A0825A
MSRLNPKQQAFADEYIITGNATKSMIKAGYSNKYANTNANKLLQNTTISKYIDKRMSEIASERIMGQEEVLEKLTSIARGELKKGTFNQTTTYNGGESKTVEKEYELVPTVEEQTKALELLGKRYALFTDKQQVEVTEAPTFVDDISGVSDG